MNETGLPMKHVGTIFFFFLLFILTISPGFSQDLSGISFLVNVGSEKQKLVENSALISEYALNRKVAHFLENYLKAANCDSVLILPEETFAKLPLSSYIDRSNMMAMDWLLSIHHETLADSEKIFDANAVNRMLLPGILNALRFKEVSFEDPILFNDDYLRLEALVSFRTILHQLQVEPYEFAAVWGRIFDDQEKTPINGVHLVLKPLGRSYKTDFFDNGFYLFSELTPGNYILETSAPGYASRHDTISLSKDQIYALDIDLARIELPFVTRSSPATQEDLLCPYDDIEIEFNRTMNARAVEEALTVVPEFPYQLSWNNERTHLFIDPIPILHFNSEYILIIDSTAKDLFDRPLDGDHDGKNSDPFFLRFHTQPVDPSRLQLLSVSPPNFATNVFRGELVRLVVNQLLDVKTIDENDLYLVDNRKEKIHLNILSTPIDRAHVLLQLIPDKMLSPDTQYILHIGKNLSDSLGHTLGRDLRFQFTTEDDPANLLIVDDLNEGVARWMNPRRSKYSRNLNLRHTRWTSRYDLPLRDSVRVGRLDYAFRSNGLVDLALVGRIEPFRNLQTEDVIGFYLYGDSSMTKVRFCFRDSADGLEVSSWHPLKWYGWQVVRFKVGTDSVFAYEGGNGLFDGEISLAGIQLSGGENQSGSLYFDDFFLVSSRITSVTENQEIGPPEEEILVQSYPTPFSRKLNHSGITITFEFPEEWGMSNVNLSIYNTLGQKVRELVNQPLQPGRYENFWNCMDETNRNVPAGVYFFRVQVGNRLQTRRLIILN